ncbi:MAG: hypothetical protein Q8S33_06865 [Myxococcales bacterium]|nr:hypothetical protein [Myxococcales bacterium]
MRVLSAVVKVLVGLTLGVVIAELVFRARDDGAFPHLNLYEEDASLGVKLAPNAQMKLKLGTNPTTTIHTNALGFRGSDWASPAPTDVLVVGDSQVFGLGVEDGETFSAQLAAIRKVNVLNAGVPTYGPGEYTALVERLVAERKPKHVVYVMNVSNDLFELGKPNSGRHHVWDGWAVRSETAPTSTVNFPFRHAVMNGSHLVYAARRLMAGSVNLAQESAGEGTWKDIVTASSVTKPLERDDTATKEALEKRNATTKQLDELQLELDRHVTDRINQNEPYAQAAKVLPPLKNGDPRDIVQVPFMEGARAVDVTAHQLYTAALGIEGNEDKLLAIAEKTKDAELKALVEKRKALRIALGSTLGTSDAHAVTPLEALFQRTKDACDQAGATLLVVALPLDVMVSKDEWKKYGKEPVDLSVTQVLLDDIVSRAEAIGALALDPTEALRKAEPGAFLDGDLHLTPKGHRAFAEALHVALDSKPKPKSALVLPEGRSWPPTDDEWRAVPEVNVKGSTAANCETRQVREWFRMTCRDLYPDEEDAPTLRVESIQVLRGGHGDVLLDGSYNQRTVILPVLDGETTVLDVAWEDHTRELILEHPKGGAPKRAFGDKEPKRKTERPNWKGMDADGNPCRDRRCEPVEWSNPLRAITCKEGEVPSGALRRCAVPCNTSAPCATGTCHPWPTGDFCGAP